MGSVYMYGLYLVSHEWTNFGELLSSCDESVDLAGWGESGANRINLADLIPTRSEEREVLRVCSIPVAILPSCQYMKMVHHNCIDMNI